MSEEVAGPERPVPHRFRRMRTLLVTLLVSVAGCDGDGSSLPVDATAAVDAHRIDARIVDAPPLIDAPMIDAPGIDAPPGSAALACMHACDALGVCFMEPTDPSCYAECEADLADCTPQQVQDIDACSTLACGDANSSPLMECIAAVPCVDM